MFVFKAYKFRMYPNNEQRKILNSFLGTSRFVFNYFLNEKEKLYNEKNINYNLSDMKKDLLGLQMINPWLKEMNGCILRNSLDDLDRAYDNFFKRRESHPKFKCRNAYEGR